MLLREKDRETLSQIFSALTAPVDILAYGSRVNGGAHAGSDLDLVIRSRDGEALPFAVVSSLKDAIRDSNIPVLVEIRDWFRLPEAFQSNISRQHELLFSNAGAIPA